jgi:hypothetical protein
MEAFLPVGGETTPRCVTCGAELHPERARKYNYCMARECQEKNAKGLTMVAVGVNKAAEQYLILDERTRDELASGKYHDQRRGSFGNSVPGAAAPGAAAPGPAAPGRAKTGTSAAGSRTRGRAEPAPRRAGVAPRRPWTGSQERLALLYNEQGMRPAEIAQKLGVSPYIVTQIILSSRNRGKL